MPCVDCYANSSVAHHGWRHIAHGIFVKCPYASACPRQVTPTPEVRLDSDILFRVVGLHFIILCRPCIRSSAASSVRTFQNVTGPGRDMHPHSCRLHRAVTHLWDTRTCPRRTRARQRCCVQSVARDSFAVVHTAASRATHSQGCQVTLPPRDS